MYTKLCLPWRLFEALRYLDFVLARIAQYFPFYLILIILRNLYKKNQRAESALLIVDYIQYLGQIQSSDIVKPFSMGACASDGHLSKTKTFFLQCTFVFKNHLVKTGVSIRRTLVSPKRVKTQVNILKHRTPSLD